MNLKDLHQNDRLKAEDLLYDDGNGNVTARDLTLQIETYHIVTPDPNGFEKIELAFVGQKKKLILNIVNQTTIANLYGTEIDGWLNRFITCYRDTTLYEGKMVDCIRIRPNVPVQAPIPPMTQPTAASPTQ